jgi:hypothetical protein
VRPDEDPAERDRERAGQRLPARAGRAQREQRGAEGEGRARAQEERVADRAQQGGARAAEGGNAGIISLRAIAGPAAAAGR